MPPYSNFFSFMSAKFVYTNLMVLDLGNQAGAVECPHADIDQGCIRYPNQRAYAEDGEDAEVENPTELPNHQQQHKNDQRAGQLVGFHESLDTR